VRTVMIKSLRSRRRMVARYVSLGAKYQATSQFDVSLGVRYTELGDARATTQNTPQANFEDKLCSICRG